MTKIVYHIVKHEDGWAFKLGDTYSEKFPSHDAALNAARVAAMKQQRPGDDDVGITWEDAEGEWHGEVVQPNDRPEVEVEDDA